MGARDLRAAAFVATAVVATGVGGYFAFQPARSGTPSFWALAGGPAMALAVVAAVWARREELLVDWLRPRSGDFTLGVVGAALFWAAGWGFSAVVTPVGSKREIWLATLYGQIGDPRVLQEHGWQVGVGIVAVVIAEEVVWRGMVTQLLADWLGSRTAWVWAAALYALAMVPTAWPLRGGDGSIDPVLPLAALAGGLLWGGMARRLGGRLVPGIIAHAFFDWAAVMMFRFWGR
jgi:membrane protease YdiL (CAAX protease family)